MKEKGTKNHYLFSVWLFTVLLTPIFMVMYLGMTEEVDIVEQLKLIPVFWIMGGLLSSPTLLILKLSNHFIEMCTIFSFAKKIIFLMIGLSCIIITFNILGGSLATKLTISYSFVFFILSLSIKRILIWH